MQLPEISNQFAILAAYGTNGLTKEHKAAIAEFKQLNEIILFFDGDAAGREGLQRNAKELKEMNCKITAVATPEKEGVNSLFVKYNKECLMQLIHERKPMDGFESSSSIGSDSIEKKSSVQTQHAASPLDISTPNKIIYECPTARYIVKGTLPKQLDKMLVSLDVQHLETGLKYRCRLDLYEEKQTRKEAREAAEKLDLRSDLVENDLSKRTDMLEELRDSDLRQSKEENSTDTMPDLPTWNLCHTLSVARFEYPRQKRFATFSLKALLVAFSFSALFAERQIQYVEGLWL